MNIIEDLYYNMSGSAASEEEKGIVALIDKNEDRLVKTLTDEQRERLEKLCDCYDELLDISSRGAFIRGFSLGAKTVIAAVQN